MSREQARIRVLSVIGSMHGGGAEKQLFEILHRLNRDRFELELYLSHREGELLKRLPTDIPIHSFWDGYAGTIRSKWDHLLGRTNQSRIGHLAQTIHRRKIDLVYDHCYLATLDAAQATFKSKVARVSVAVIDPRSEVHFYAGGHPAHELQKASRAYATADAVIAVSDGVKRGLIADLAVPPERIEVIFNMIDVEKALELSLAPGPDFEVEHFHIVTVGRLVEQKGIDLALAGLNILVNQRGLKNLRWHFVGDGPLKKDLHQRAVSLGLEQYTRWHGYQSNPYPFYRAANLFVLPSRYEGFGCVLIEALACGIRVVATDCPSGPSEILENGQYGTLIPAESPLDIADAVQKAASRARSPEIEATSQRAYVRSRFSYEAGIPRIEQLFERVIDSRQCIE